MSQISPPIRVVLVLAVAVMGLYMLFLRPKDEVVPPPAVQPSEAAVSQPGQVAEAAQSAVAAADSQLAQQESVDGVDAGEAAAAATAGSAAGAPKAGAARVTAADLEGVPASVARPLQRGKFLVLLFWNGRSADDLAVREAVREADRHGGRVHVEVASIKKISRYGRITRGVDVEQSPTVVVVDPKLRAEALVGYLDTPTVDQAVVDAMRNAGGLFTDAYLRSVHSVCNRSSNVLASIPNLYGADSPAKADTRLAAVDRSFGRLVTDFRAVKAPKRWRAFRAASLADMTAISAAIGRFSAAVTPTASAAAVGTAAQRYGAAVRPVGKRADKRFDAQGLFRCGSQY